MIRKRYVAASIVATLLVAGNLFGCEEPPTAEGQLSKAEELRENGQFRASVIELKNLLQNEPDNPDARWLLGLNYLDLGDNFSAETELVRARDGGINEYLVLRPLAQAWLLQRKFDKVFEIAQVDQNMQGAMKADILVLRGFAELGAGNFREAQENFEKALKIDDHTFGPHLGFARLARIRGDQVTAETHLAKAIEIAPDEIQVLIFKANLAHEMQDYATSEATYERLIELRPERSEFRIGLARAQIGIGKLDTAIASLDAILKAAPRNLRAKFLRGLAAYKKKDFQTALAHTEVVLATIPDDLPSILIAGSSHFALGQYEQAASRLQTFVNRVPGNAGAKRMLGTTRIKLGQPKEALEVLKSLVDENTTDASLLGMTGTAALRTGDVQQAADYFRRGVEVAPDNADLQAGLGVTRVALGKLDEGIANLAKAVELKPDNLKTQTALILNLMRAKRNDEAMERARKLQQRMPDEPSGFTFEGMVHAVRGDDEKAKASFQTSLRKRPGDFNAIQNLATLAVQNGMYDEARQYLESAATQEKPPLAALVMLADLEARLNRSAQSIAWLEKAIEQFPEDSQVRLYLGRAYLRKASPQKALATIRPVLKGQETRPRELLFVAGRAYMQTRQYHEAADVLHAAIALAPGGIEPRLLLVEAYAGLQETDEMKRVLEEAIKVAPNDPRPKVVLARTLIRSKELDAVGKILDDLEQMGSVEKLIPELRGDLAFAGGDAKGALAAYRTALAAVGTQEVAVKIANALWFLNDRTASIAHLESWLEQHPQGDIARAQLASYLLASDDLARARDQFSMLTQRRPDDWVPHNDLAWVLTKLGQPEAALPHAERAYELAKSSPITKDTLGTVYLALGRTEQALILLRGAAQQAPDQPGIGFNFARALHAAGKPDEALSVLQGILDGGKPFRTRQEAEALLKQLGG